MKKTKFDSVEEILAAETGEFFRGGIVDGIPEYGHHKSLMGRMIPHEHITFDVSNNRVLGNIGITGEVKSFTTYRNSYPGDNHLPGIWWYKDLTTTGPYAWSIKVDGEEVDLAATASIRTALLGNMFPLTVLETDRFHIKLISFAPISSDGTKRPGALFVGVQIANISDESLSLSVGLPKSYENSNVYFANGSIEDRSRTLEIAKGEDCWFPGVIVALPGRTIMRELGDDSFIHWFNETWEFYRRMIGHLEMEDDPFAAEFLPRMIHLCFCAVCINESGEVVGANWGSYPATTQIWMRDMGYTVLPLFSFDPDLFKKVLLWFLDKGIRYVGDKRFEGYALGGGIDYSLTNALTPVVIAGLYYRSSGDHTFFEQYPGIIKKIRSLIDELIPLRDEDTSLFPSVWISDGPSRGDFHTGSNVVAWYCLTTAAELIGDIVGDKILAGRYREIADKTAEGIVSFCRDTGPEGMQFVEGRNRDGSTLFDHDGEESDTTLMPFYGFAGYDDPAYQNHVRVALTEANRYYKTHTNGIEDSTWIDSHDNPGIDATFPGYITGFAGVQNGDEMSGPDGRLSVIRRLTDIDGSIWWWPYKHDKVVRAFEIEGEHVGKSGWAAAVYILHFVSQILGLVFDGPGRSLTFRPFSPSSRFAWTDFPLGTARFSVGYARAEEKVSYFVENLNAFPITARTEAILAPNAKVSELMINGTLQDPETCETDAFFTSTTARIEKILAPGEKADFEVTYG